MPGTYTSVLCHTLSDVVLLALFDFVTEFKNMGPLPKGEARRYGGECDRIVSFLLIVLSKHRLKYEIIHFLKTRTSRQ
jgi:hypothetical protein